MQKELGKLKATAKEKRESIMSELSGLSKKIQSLSSRKQIANKNKVSRIKYINQINLLEKNLEKVSAEYSLYLKSFSSQENFAMGLDLDQNLDPLESKLNKVSSQHSGLMEKLGSLKKEAERQENVLSMTKEDLFALSVMRAELICSREDLEMEVEMMEFEYPDELEYCEEEDEFIKSMIKIKKEKEPIEQKISSLEASYNGTVSNISMTEQILLKMTKEIMHMCVTSPSIDEIKNIEEALKEKNKLFQL